MSYVRRIAQGLLAAFAVTAIVLPMPAWALRQGAAAQNEETTAGLEEKLTGNRTTMNRREFFKTLGTKIAPAAAVGAGLGRMVVANPTGEPSVATDSGPIVQELTKTVATIAGAAVMGTAVAVALAPADAEKLLAELLSTDVSRLIAFTSGKMLRQNDKILVLVDDEVADREIVMKNHSRFLYPDVASGHYPNVVVAPLSEASAYLRDFHDRSAIAILAPTTVFSALRIDANVDAVRVEGLNGQRVGSNLLPVVVTAALAQWSGGGFTFDMTPYWAVRDLTADQVWQVLSSQFA